MEEVKSVNKVVRDGKVAVLYSPGYGAGWSTWNTPDVAERLIFDPKLVEMVECNVDIEEIVAYVNSWGDDDDHICTLGAGKLTIEWVPQGERFDISEYDGNESVRIFGPHYGFVA